jgi:hypothetical protein
MSNLLLLSLHVLTTMDQLNNDCAEDERGFDIEKHS